MPASEHAEETWKESEQSTLKLPLEHVLIQFCLQLRDEQEGLHPMSDQGASEMGVEQGESQGMQGGGGGYWAFEEEDKGASEIGVEQGMRISDPRGVESSSDGSLLPLASLLPLYHGAFDSAARDDNGNTPATSVQQFGNARTETADGYGRGRRSVGAQGSDAEARARVARLQEMKRVKLGQGARKGDSVSASTSDGDVDGEVRPNSSGRVATGGESESHLSSKQEQKQV